MGMRAVFAVKENNEMRTVTVQWASYTPETVPLALAMVMQEEGISFEDAVRKGVAAVTQFEHISALEVLTSFSEGIDSQSATYLTSNGGAISIAGGVVGPAPAEYVSSHQEFLSRVTQHPHTQDGISVIVDLDTSETVVEFYQDLDYGDSEYPRLPGSAFFEPCTAETVTEYF